MTKMTIKDIFVRQHHMEILENIVEFHKRLMQTQTIWKDFEEQAITQIYPGKAFSPEFQDAWETVCRIMRYYGVLTKSGIDTSVPRESLYSDRLQKTMERIGVCDLPAGSAGSTTEDDEAIIAMLHQLVQHIVCRMNMNLNIDWAAWIELKEQGAVILNLKSSQDLWKKAIKMVFSHKHFIGSKSTVDHDLKIISTIATELRQKIDAAKPVKVGDVAGPVMVAINDEDSENHLVTDLHRRILQSPVDSRMEIKVPSANYIRAIAVPTSGAAGSKDPDTGPAGFMPSKPDSEKIEATVIELREQLASEFKKSIGKGPLPHDIAIHIINMMAGEYCDNNNYQNAIAGLITELVQAGRNPIRYVSWMECSRILDRARSIVKGVKPRVDHCMLGEYAGIFKDLEPDKEKP